MRKSDLVREVVDTLKVDGARKIIFSPKHAFHISDDEGNIKDFVVKKSNKKVLYTIDDVEKIIDATLEVITESIRRGEEVSLHKFGVFGLQHKGPRVVRSVYGDERYDVPERFVFKFVPGAHLTKSAKLYSMSAFEQKGREIEPFEEGDS